MNNLSFKLILLFLLLPTYALFGKLSAESSVLEQTMVCPTGDLNFSTQAEVDAFPINYPNCTHITASLVYISGPDITDLSPLAGIINIDGNLTISGCPQLVSLAGLSGLVTLQGGLFIGYDNDLLTDIGLPNLVLIGTFLDIQFNSALTTLTGLENLLSVQDFYIFNNPELIDFGSSLVLTSIQNSIEIVDNPKLSNLLGLSAIADLGDLVNINGNPELVSLQGLHNIALFNGDFIASNNAKLSTCAITSVCRHLSNGGTITVGNNAPSGCDSQVEVENICDSIACNINGGVAVQGTGTSGTGSTACTVLGGTITLSDGRAVPNTNINLSGSVTTTTATNITGDYSFTVPSSGTYTISPFEDDNHSNGVNIGDMLKIARHIAHIEHFDTPLQLIAADVNRDGRVNSRDRTEVFQLVLGRESRFDNNTSWRFIPKSHIFPASTLPPTGQPGISYPESITLLNVVSDTTGLDFWGVKIGDVDSMATLPRIEPFLEVNIGSMDIPMDNIPETITIPVKVNNFTDVAGIQFSLNWDPSILRYKGAKMMNLGGEVEQATVNSGTLKYVWSNETGTNESMPSNSTIFEAEFEVMSEQLIDAQRMVVKMPDDQDDDEPLSTAPLVIRDISTSTNLTRNASRSSQVMQSLAVSSPIQQGGVITINSTTIPTMSEWGLLIFGLLLLNLGVFLVQYKQQMVKTLH